MSKKLMLSLVAGAILAAGVWGYMSISGTEQTEAIDVVEKTATVVQGDIVIDFVSDGNVEIPIYDLSFESTGTVESVNVKVGDYVEKGTVLAELEKDGLERSLLEAQLDLEVALKQQALSLSGYGDDEQNFSYQSNVLWGKYEDAKEVLVMMQTISEVYPAQDIEDQQTLVDESLDSYNNYVSTSKPNTSIESDLDVITVEKARMKIEEIEENIEGMIITANVNGWIVEVNYSSGEVTESAEPVILIEEDGPIYVETYVPEDDIGDVTVGQKATFEADAVAGITYDAVVEQVSRAPEVGSNGLVSYKVLLQADEEDRQLMDGMTSTVNFTLVEKLDVLILPNDAIEKRDGGQYVTLKLEDGAYVDQKIFAGFTDGSQVEILSGLEAGMTVVYEE